MQIILDTGDINQISRLVDLFPIEGVTTNPTLVAKEKTDAIALLKEIRGIIGKNKMLHAQALGTTAEEMVEEAEYLNDLLGGEFYIKIPVTQQGIKAMMMVKKRNIKITATAVFTPMQAHMAAKAGADYVAPYVNRLDNIGADGVKTVTEIADIFKIHQLNTKILAASFKNVEQVVKSCLGGAHAITAAPEIVEQLLYHPLTDWSVEQFTKDWEAFYGEGKKVNNL